MARKDRGLKLQSLPFSGVDPEILKSAFKDLGNRKKLEFPELSEKLKDILRKYDPEVILAITSAYGLTQSASDESVEARSGYLRKISQHHLEILQAFILSLNSEELGFELPRSDVIQNVFDTLIDLSDAFHLRRQADVIEENDALKQREKMLQETIRLHTQNVRNWGHFQDVLDASRRMFTFIETRCPDWSGWKPTDAILVFEFLLNEVEDRLTQRFRRLKRIFRSRKPNKVISEFCRSMEYDAEEKQKIKKMARDENWDIETTQMILISFLDLSLTEVFTFDIDNICQSTKLDRETLDSVVSELSYSFGDLKSLETEFFFLGNPVWQKPIINKNAGELFIPMPSLFFSFVLQNFSKIEKFREGVIKFRPDFLEEEIESSIKDFSEADLFITNFKWKSDDQEFENDHVVLFDNQLLLVEDKAGHLSPPALRGALGRAKSHAKEILGEGSEQSKRLMEVLSSASEDVSVHLGELEKRKEHIKDYHRIVLTLHDLHPLTLHLKEMRDIGWVSDDFDLAHTMHFTEFRCLLDILGNPIFLFHYLKQRKRLRDNQFIMGDELDWLALYLQSGFNFHELEEKNIPLIITGMSESIDLYYESKRLNLKKKKPKPTVSPLWRSIIDQLSERKFNSFIEAGSDLLSSASPDEQVHIEKKFGELIKSVRKNWRNPEHLNCIIIVPPTPEKSAVVLFAYPDQLKDKKKESAQNIVDQIFSESEAKKCVMFGKNIDEQNYAYSFVSIMQRNDND